MKRLERTIPILLMLTILLCSCSKSQGAQWQEQYDLGVRYLSEGNYEEAIIAFTAAIEIDPNRVDAYIGLADTYLVIGDYVSAAAVWDTTQITDAELLSTFANQSDRYSEIQAELESGEPGVWITSLSFDQESFLAGEETAFYVMALYRTPENGNFQMAPSPMADPAPARMKPMREPHCVLLFVDIGTALMVACVFLFRRAHSCRPALCKNQAAARAAVF